MLYQNVNNLEPDMIVGKDIFDSLNNSIILKNGTKLTNFHIEYLKNHGYKGIYIEDQLAKDIIIKDIIPNELKHESVRDLNDLDIISTLKNAQKIVDEIIKQSDIYFDEINVNSNAMEHSIKVAEFSIVMGKALNLDNERLIDLASAALLHDIGKRLDDPEVLKKLGFDGAEGNYKDELYPLYGYRLLSSLDNVKAPIKTAILTHNMNEDGTNKLDINQPIKQHLYGKIIHVADMYEQVLSGEYGDELATPSEAMEFLMGGCGSKFNLEVVETFKNYVPIYPKSTRVILSNNLTGLVFKNNPENPLRPCLILENGQLVNLMDPKYSNLTVIDSYNKETKKDIAI